MKFALVSKKNADADEEPGRQVMADEIRLHIETIARHLRGIGLTEHQIELHIAPLKPRQVELNPPRRKIARPNNIESHFAPRSRKGVYSA